MKSSTIIWFIVVIIIIGGGWYLLGSGQTPSDSASLPDAVSEVSEEEAAQAPMSATVMYGPNGFHPETITIAKGGTVAFKNQDSIEMWIASDVHPTHEGYNGTTKNEHCPDTAGAAFDQCGVGPTYSFTFDKVGTWAYHNHRNARDGGVVIVQ